MSTTTTTAPYTPTFLDRAAMVTFTPTRYDAMVHTGILTSEDKVELLENHVVLKMPGNPSHDGTILRISKQLVRRLPAGWDVRCQLAIVLADSRPEPDLAIVPEDPDDYTKRHPAAAETRFVIEVANTSLLIDQRDKARIYARGGVVCYWIINLEANRVEVHTQPSGPCDSPAYASVVNYAPGDLVPLILDGVTVANIPVAELLP